MKKLLSATLLLSLCLASCDIVESKAPADGGKQVQWGEVSFSLSGNALETRSTTQAAESAVTNLQVLVYNASGNLVAYAGANSGTVSATVPLGIAGHTVYAVTNVPDDLSLCSTPSSLTSKVSYLKRLVLIIFVSYLTYYLFKKVFKRDHSYCCSVFG